MIRNSFKEVLDHYLEIKLEPFNHNNVMYKIVEEELISEFAKIAPIDEYSIQGSVGVGDWAEVPLILICDKKINENVPLCTVAYLFKKDMSGVYLSLNFLIDEYKRLYASRNSVNIKEDVGQFRKLISTKFDISSFETNIDLVSNESAPKNYERANLLAKYYDKDNLPSEEDLIKDLKEFLEIYSFLIDEYSKNTYISPEQWLEVLNNPEVIDEKMMDILRIIYNLDDHAATTSEIAAKREEEGFFGEKSYNWNIVYNGKRLVDYFGKNDILNEDGEKIYWKWFFRGRMKDKAFQFIMKEELVEAFDMLDEDNVFKDVVSFMEYLKLKGFLFDTEIVEDYLLSLKVKPFVIFTGNSGTGKTKLAQLFIDFISKGDNLLKSEFIENKKIGSFKGNSGKWSLSKNAIKELIPLVDEYQKDKEISVNGVKGKANFELMLRLGIQKGELYDYVGKLEDEDSDQKIDINIDLDSPVDIVSEQYELIPVGANWTESRNILGFQNVITGDYEETPAYNLIKEAQKNTKTPYFLILDEMNLSHVERYFAEFLSAMESQEPIPISADEELAIPKNLFIVGTVNVDETTYMFSPKVLDRANTIEFKTMSAMDYMNSNFENYHLSGDESYLLNPLSDEYIRNMNIHELKAILNDVKCPEGKLWDVLSEQLENFQSVLKKANFDFGFRVINEILRFMVISWKYEREPQNWKNWQRYFDAQIKQKMLPKLHGSQKVLGPVIKELFELCLNESQNNLVPRLVELDKSNAKFYTSALKLQEMDQNLYNQRYTSFVN